MELKLSMNPDWMSAKSLEANVKLSCCQLSSAYLCQRLALVRQVDLSENELTDRSLPALGSLQLCQKLNLRANKLVALTNFPHLPFLKDVDLSDNQLAVASAVKDNLVKANLTSLEILNVSNNPCSDSQEIEELMNTLNVK
jgi:Leucine-rich repeat (LRR) protein